MAMSVILMTVTGVVMMLVERLRPGTLGLSKEAGLLEVRNLTVRFGDTTAVDDLSLTVGTGEIVCVLGPSGCGKSTLLRVIAGLEEPATGTVRWEGEDITRLPVHRRGFGLMFQDYALFPHRSVAANVAFGLRMQGLGKGRSGDE